MSRYAFVGLGVMGSRMAGRLLDAGHRLIVWNRTTEKTASLAARGAEVAATPADAAAGADAVVTMLADPDALRDVTERQDGVLAGMRAGATLIEMSTVGPSAIQRLASMLPEGVALMDAPVLGSTTEAESGRLRIFMGGDDGVVARWRDELAVLGEPLHVGPLGSGSRAKLVANSTLFGVLSVFGEAIALADALGLPREATFEVLSGTPVGAQVERRRAAIESGDYPFRFAMSLALKDATLVQDAAAAAGVDMRVARAARSWIQSAVDAGMAERDYASMLTHIVEGRENH